MLLVGFHGTSESAAKGILRDGFRNMNERMRAGPGAYFWAGEGALEDRAKSLAVHWAQQKKAKGDYGSAEGRLAIIRAEFEVDPYQYIDLDQRGHHLGLVAYREKCIASGLKIADEATLYAQYIEFQEKQFKSRGVSLKVVKALMPAPARFKWDFTPYLTSNVLAYIVRPNAMDLLGPSAISQVDF